MWRFSEIRVLPDIVRYWSKITPDKVALKDGSLNLTYRELDESSNRIANRIIATGVSPGAHIGYVGRNSVEFFEVWFGACKAGCAIAPFNWRSAPLELAVLAGDAETPLIFAESDLCSPKVLEARSLGSLSYEVVNFSLEGNRQQRFEGWAEQSSNQDPHIAVYGDDVALLVYTSGTTGRPKGVQYSHEAFDRSFLCMSLEPEMAWAPEDVGLMVVPNFHLGGNWVLLPALYHGATIRTIPAFDSGLILEAIEADRCTIMPLVPTALQMLLEHPGIENTDLSSLHKIIYFGSPISAETMTGAVTTLGCKLNQLYGTTETWFATLLGHEEHIAEPPLRLSSCGKPLPLIMMKVCNGEGEELPHRQVGEIYIRTPTINKGYWKQPEATVAAISDGWYRTGDLAWSDEQGFFYLVDRAKDMIVSGGENIYSVEVERVLNLHKAISMAAVIGTPDKKWGEKVTAFVVLEREQSASEDELKQHCREYLAGYKVPKEILIKESLPMNLTGKIQKNILREPYWSGKNRRIC